MISANVGLHKVTLIKLYNIFEKFKNSSQIKLLLNPEDPTSNEE